MWARSVATVNVSQVPLDQKTMGHPFGCNFSETNALTQCRWKCAPCYNVADHEPSHCDTVGDAESLTVDFLHGD